MIAFVLAGGRGRRLGALVSHRQKVTLRYRGNPIIENILRNALHESRIRKVYVLTGYRSNDVHMVIERSFSQAVASGRLHIIDLPLIHGNLARLTAALSRVNSENGLCICGSEIMVSRRTFRAFFRHIDATTTDAVILLSPNVNTAPTHSRFQMENGVITQYASWREAMTIDGSWFVDVGVRYFPQWMTREILQMNDGIQDRRELPQLYERLMAQRRTMRGVIFSGHWKHSGVPSDFTT